jgi:hypothetical protein
MKPRLFFSAVAMTLFVAVNALATAPQMHPGAAQPFRGAAAAKAAPRPSVQRHAAPHVEHAGSLSAAAANRKISVLGHDLEGIAHTVFSGRPPSFEAVEKMFQPPPGYSLRVRSVRSASRTVTFGLELRDAHGRLMTNGPTEQGFSLYPNGELVVEHREISLRPAYRGKGIEDHIFANALRAYASLGVKRLDGDFALGDDRYTAATHGFSWPEGQGPESEFATFLKKSGVRSEAAARLAKTARKAHLLADVDVDGRKLGKEFLLSPECPPWRSILRLDPADEGYRAFTTRMNE